MDGFKVDYGAMMQQIKDHVAIELLASMSPTEEDAKRVVAIMEVFVKNGVSVETAMKIMTELGPVLDKYTKKKESDQ